MVVERVVLSPHDDDYKEIKANFDTHNDFFDKRTKQKKILEIVKIERVFNYRLHQNFLQKEKEYLSKYGFVRKFKLFHGTKKVNISSILENNLDVQRHGQNVGHRFGAGVSFSALAKYASNYCDMTEMDTMLVCQVLISNIVEVQENKNKNSVIHEPPYLPDRYPLRYDTTAKNKIIMDVVVKFERDAFYPAYVITFKRKLHQTPSFTFDEASLMENNSYLNHTHSNVNLNNCNSSQSHYNINSSHSNVNASKSNVSRGHIATNHLNISGSRSIISPSHFSVNPNSIVSESHSRSQPFYLGHSNVNANASHPRDSNDLCVIS